MRRSTFEERMMRRERVELECDDDHDPVTWTVTVRPGSRCTLIHNYCGPMNPDCNFIESEIVDGDPCCPTCGKDFTEHALDDAAEQGYGDREAQLEEEAEGRRIASNFALRFYPR